MIEVGELTTKYAQAYPKQFAAELGVHDGEDVATILKSLESSVALKVVSHLPASFVTDMVQRNLLSATHLLADADTDDAAQLLTKLPRQECIAFVRESADRSVRRKLMRFLNYPPHSVGSMVSKPTLTLDAHDSIESARLAMQGEALAKEPSVLVVTDTGAYVGVIDVWKILAATDPAQPLSELVDEVEPIYAETEHSLAAQNVFWGERNWMPVIDHEGRVVGVLWRWDLTRETDQGRDTVTTLEQGIIGLTTDFFRVLNALLNMLFGRGKL